jgi:hypothetical protein
MYTELKRKVVNCRKAHMCAWCAEKINVGQSAQYRSYVYDGDFNNDWMHLECELACVEYALNEGSFEFMPGDFPRGSTEAY